MGNNSQVPLPYRREQPHPFSPAPELQQLGREKPISRQSVAPNGDSVWLVTRHSLAREVLSDHRFSVKSTPPTLLRPKATGEAKVATPARQPGSFVGYDHPEHARLRSMVSHSFTAKRIADWVPRIEEIVHDCLDAMATQGPPADLATAFGQEIPSRVLCELIGIPEEDRKELQMRANLAFDQTLDRGRLIDHFVGLRDWVADLVVQKRNSPDNTMFGALVRDYGHELTDTEITGMVALILVAGQDSTAGALNIGTLLLLRHPDQLAVVRDDPTITEQAVEELLRYITVTQTGLVRTATEDLELGGEQIKKGDYVMMSFSQANRDETVYQDANVFDVHREREPHLAFGHGIHFCLGAPLARKELAIGIPALLRRFPDLKLAIPFEEVPFREFATVYGVESLPVTW